MKAGLHVITEKLMGHTVHECKEMARVAEQTELASGHRPSAALQHSLRQRDGANPPRHAGRSALHPRPMASRQPARQRQLAAALAARHAAERRKTDRSARRKRARTIGKKELRRKPAPAGRWTSGGCASIRSKPKWPMRPSTRRISAIKITRSRTIPAKRSTKRPPWKN